MRINNKTIWSQSLSCLARFSLKVVATFACTSKLFISLYTQLFKNCNVNHSNVCLQVSPNCKEIASAIHVMITEMNTAFFTPFYHYTPGIWEKHKKLVSEVVSQL